MWHLSSRLTMRRIWLVLNNNFNKTIPLKSRMRLKNEHVVRRLDVSSSVFENHLSVSWKASLAGHFSLSRSRSVCFSVCTHLLLISISCNFLISAAIRNDSSDMFDIWGWQIRSPLPIVHFWLLAIKIGNHLSSSPHSPNFDDYLFCFHRCAPLLSLLSTKYWRYRIAWSEHTIRKLLALLCAIHHHCRWDIRGYSMLKGDCYFHWTAASL